MSLTEKINSVCRSALEKGLVGGVVTLRRTAENAAVHALVTKPDQIEETDPLMPYFPGNGADFVKKLTRIAPPRNKKILVILRPCEMRAAVELTKLAQIQNENIVWMTFDCLGTIPRKEFEDKPIPGGDEFYSDPEREDIRPLCATCDFVRVNTADIGFLAFEDGAPFVAYTETGKQFLSDLGVEFTEKPVDDKFNQIQQKRNQNKAELYGRLEKEVKGIDNLIKTFARCVNCHNCMTNCPICFCRECFFESEAMDFEGDIFLDLAERRGGLRAPTDVGLFHLGRMSHMATSCVACGACEEACPEGIIVGQVFKWVSENVQKVFDYVAGRDWEAEVPLRTFREDELTEVTGMS